MIVNFSIPVNLFNYRESDNPLYSYAKLKIFYKGLTGDKRLFTDKFSNKLLESLPYVPVVGYYSDEKEDFEGHHPSLQQILGLVPETTGAEFIHEDGKDYAVCDIILYTGRGDKTGDLAQKIVGKKHSLELNPKTTTYVVNKDSQGKVLNIEFKSGTLLGLSILGDNEQPAFSGSEFFTENSEFTKIVDGLREQLEIFAKEEGQRGETMEQKNIQVIPKGTPVVEEVEPYTDFEPATESNAAEFVEEVETTTTDVDLNENQTTVSPEKNNEQIIQEPTQEQKFLNIFMRASTSEIEEKVFSKFYSVFGENVYAFEWSFIDSVIIFVDFVNGEYHKVLFESDGEGNDVIFGEAVVVRRRFLTDDEINTLWPKNLEKENFNSGLAHETEIVTEGSVGTVENNELSNINGGDRQDEFKAEEKEKEDAEKRQRELDSIALNRSEREELEAFRKDKKRELIESFEDDLKKDFLEALKEKVDEFTYEELDIVLSKEFTRISKKENKIKPNTFVYTGDTNSSSTRTEAEIVSDLVNKYKTRK